MCTNEPNPHLGASQQQNTRRKASCNPESRQAQRTSKSRIFLLSSLPSSFSSSSPSSRSSSHLCPALSSSGGARGCYHSKCFETSLEQEARWPGPKERKKKASMFLDKRQLGSGFACVPLPTHAGTLLAGRGRHRSSERVFMPQKNPNGNLYSRPNPGCLWSRRVLASSTTLPLVGETKQCVVLALSQANVSDTLDSSNCRLPGTRCPGGRMTLPPGHSLLKDSMSPASGSKPGVTRG